MNSPKLDALCERFRSREVIYRLMSVEVAHDDHCARFRPPNVNEHAATIHWLRQHEIIGAWVDAGMQSLRPAIDGDAMLPHGVAFDSTGDIVVGLDEDDQTKWVNCKQCVDLGVEAIRRGITPTDPASHM